MRSVTRTHVGTFSDSVQTHLRTSGYSQKELADALGLHPKVLSRKLHGSGNAHLTHLEVRRIVTSLAGWQVITTQDEALQLLELAQVDHTLFSADEWRMPPLSTLATKHAQSFPYILSVSAAPAPRHNLPATTTRLIGRERAVQRLRQLLGCNDVRLVTLVGAGGSGKTRLALQVGSEVIGTFAQGVWFVTLAGVYDPDLVPISILQALHISSTPGLPPLQSLVSFLHNKQLLLVLDNFEQVGAAAAVVHELLAAAPGLKVLVTSRTVLHLYGEREFRVPPLEVPEPGTVVETADLLQYGAIQLFVERAQAVVPDFTLTAGNGAIIAQICARVDGLPLALELAAARIKVLPASSLLARLSQARLPLLIGGARNLPGRQQTLRNTMTWSYDLLSPVEQAWFSRLGVFSGSWSLEAAEAMMQGEATDLGSTPVSSSPIDMLERLVDNSLLVRQPVVNGHARFTMLETLREYALERLATQKEVEQLRDWHAGYYLKVAEAAEIGLRGPQQLVWLEKLNEECDNFRAALEWSLQRARMDDCKAWQGQALRATTPPEPLQPIEVCLRLASALRHYWEWQGNLTEARYWLGAALEVPPGDEVGETQDKQEGPGQPQGPIHHPTPPLAPTFPTRAPAMSPPNPLSLLAARAKALSEASRLMCLQNNQSRAVALAEESIALGRQLGDPIRVASALLHRGWAAHASGEYETAKDMYQEGLQQLLTMDDPWLRGQLLFHLAAAAGFMGNFEYMRSLYAQGRALFEQLGDKSSAADLLKDQGGMLLLEGNCTMAIGCLLKSVKLCYELDHKQHMTTGICLLSIAFGMSGKPDPTSASIHSAQLEGVADSLEGTIGLTPWTKTNPLVQMIRQQIRSQVDEQSWEAARATGRALTLEQAIDLACRLGADFPS